MYIAPRFTTEQGATPPVVFFSFFKIHYKKWQHARAIEKYPPRKREHLFFNFVYIMT